MAEPLADQVMWKIEQADELYHRLMLVVAPAGAGKTTALQDIQERVGAPLREASGNLLTTRLRKSSRMAQKLSVFPPFLRIRLRTPWRRSIDSSLSSGKLGRLSRFSSFQHTFLIFFASILFSMETAVWPDS